MKTRTKRGSAVFYESFHDAIEDLPEEMQLGVYRALCRYAFYGEEPETGGVASCMFKLMRDQLDNGIRG